MTGTQHSHEIQREEYAVAPLFPMTRENDSFWGVPGRKHLFNTECNTHPERRIIPEKWKTVDPKTLLCQSEQMARSLPDRIERI